MERVRIRGGLMGTIDIQATLTRIPQGADTFIRVDGHSRSSGCHICLSTD